MKNRYLILNIFMIVLFSSFVSAAFNFATPSGGYSPYEPNPTYPASNTVDGNDGTPWVSGEDATDNPWIDFNVSGCKDISQVKIRCHTSTSHGAAGIDSWKWEGSPDNISWEEGWSGATTGADSLIWRPADGIGDVSNVKYVRLTTLTGGSGIEINEVLINVSPNTGCDEDSTAPTNSTWNVTSATVKSGQSSIAWNTGGTINVTSNLLSLTVVTNENSNGSCVVDQDWNYTTAVANNTNYKFSTTETTAHSYTVYDNISLGNHCLYCSFIDSNGNEYETSTSGCLNFTRLADDVVPTLSAYDVSFAYVVSGQSTDSWSTNESEQINVTYGIGLTLNFTASEASNCSCRLGTEQNYTEMLAADANYKIATTEVTSHHATLYDTLSIGTQCLYCSCIDGNGNEPAAGDSQSECLNISLRDVIRGQVKDSNGIDIAGAWAYVIDPDTNITVYNITTNSSGGFSYVADDIKIYSVSVFHPTNYSLEPDAKHVNVTG